MAGGLQRATPPTTMAGRPAPRRHGQRPHRLHGLAVILSLVAVWPPPASAEHHRDTAPIRGAPGGKAAETVSHRLRQLFEQRPRRAQTLTQFAAGRGMRTIGDAVVVDVVLRGYTDDLEQRIEAAGGTVRAMSLRQHRVSVAIPDAASLERVGALPEVQYVYPEYGPVTRAGSVDSRAPRALAADAIGPGSGIGLTGSGQKVGILSDSFARTAPGNGVVDGDTLTDGTPIGASGNATPVTLERSVPQDSGDLPPAVELRKDDATGSLKDEGAAMAELIHDLAPDAALSFYTAFVSLGDFAAGIADLCGPANATVVVDDVAYLNELMYQRDVLSRAAEHCVAAGVPYFSAAGNTGDTAFRRAFRDVDPNDNNDSGRAASLEGDFYDWNPAIGDPHLAVTLSGGEGFTAVLQWNQPALSVPENTSNGPRVDLDFYISRSHTSFFSNLITESGFHVSSFLDQRAGDPGSGADPVEIVRYVNKGSAAETVYLGIDHWAGSRGRIPQDAGTDLEFRLVFFEILPTSSAAIDYEYAPGAATMFGHPVADGVISVGAVPWWETPAFDPAITGTPATDPESFTAKGGSLQHHFRPDGSFLRRTLAPQPTLAAVDGTNTTFFGQDDATPTVFDEPDGFPNFFGTSAAAPNAAAVAALLLQVDDTLIPAEIEARLRTSAVDVAGTGAAPGCDDRTGSGLIDATTAVTASDRAPMADAGDDQDTVGGRNVTLDGSTSRDNLGIDSFRWTQVAGPAVGLSNPAGAQTSFDAPESGSTLMFELRVIDTACLSDADRVRIEVQAVDGLGGGGSGGGWLLLIGLAGLLARRCRV